ncbi:MAG: DegT/DnrJ/EryC1/StrS family aminotransferase [Lachnospiraceae bacterium]|nr:DegT/DnrJ/EryC1/StrS family aminotransferase [Lachnospiraceae bacterium]
MENKKKIWLSSPTMHGEEQEFVKEAFTTNWVAPLGPNVNSFEEEMAAYEGIGHAAALSAGTAAIHMAMILAGVEPGDIVFCQDLTFSASCNPVRYQHAVPVFIDSEKETWNMSPAALRAAFEKYPHPKAVVAVDLYGTPAKLDEIAAICREHDVPLIEDAAEALGSVYMGRKCGTYGKYGILSFNGNKIITTSGGGMLISDDEEAVRRVRFLSTQARDPAPYYQHSVIGYNYRMSNVVAGIGRGQLLHLDEHVRKKQEIRKRYQEAFADMEGVSLNPVPQDDPESNSSANCWLTCIRFDRKLRFDPLKLFGALQEENIESRPIWKPMHLQPVFADCDLIRDPDEELIRSGGEESVSASIFGTGLCLPSDIKNTEEDMERVISVIRRVTG